VLELSKIRYTHALLGVSAQKIQNILEQYLGKDRDGTEAKMPLELTQRVMSVQIMFSEFFT
jgi:hypothetical protein